MIRNFREGGRDRGHSGGFGGSRGGFGGGSRGGFGGSRGGFNRRDRDSGPREMFDATCTKCGKACRVPFKPTGSKPVLCSDCFSKDDSSSSNRFAGAQSPANSKQLDQINAKLDKILAVLKELELDTEEDVELADESEDFDEDAPQTVHVVETEDEEEL